VELEGFEGYIRSNTILVDFETFEGYIRNNNDIFVGFEAVGVYQE